MFMTRRLMLTWGSLGVFRRLQADAGRIAPSPDSEFVLIVKKTGLMAGKKHRLVFKSYEGSFSQAPKPQVIFTVQTASLICEDDWVKPKDREKIRSYAVNDFLEAAKYPNLSYRSIAVRAKPDGYQVEGNLTVKNETQPVTVNVIRKAIDGKDRWSGSAEIRLTAFKLKPPTAAFGAIGTEDLMELTFRF